MSSDVAIKVEGVSKAYRIWKEPSARLASPALKTLAHLFPAGSSPHASLTGRAESYYRDFWALKDISLEVCKGEAVGIIGRNGSGKSTLLQIIAGTLQPTNGTVEVNGRVAALLELGSGFNPEFTGRENVFLNAAILGLTRREIEERFDSIAAFADIGDFLEQPVKTYSSGMLMRLAFAVATSVDADVLIIDEALSVGDAPFQAKCFARIRRMMDQGTAILFVSHDLGTVRTFCQSAIWLLGGRAEQSGDGTQICDAYGLSCLREMGMQITERAGSEPASKGRNEPQSLSSSYISEDRGDFERNARLGRHGDGAVRIANFFLAGEDGRRRSMFRWNDRVSAVFILSSATGYDGLFQLGYVAKTLQGHELLCCSDRTHTHRLEIGSGNEKVAVLEVQMPLRSGKYSVIAAVFLFPDDARFPHGTYDFSRSVASDYIDMAAFVEIEPQFNEGIHGPVQFDAKLVMPPLDSNG